MTPSDAFEFVSHVQLTAEHTIDSIVQLREWGSDKVIPLSASASFLFDSNQRVEWDGEHWWLWKTLPRDSASDRRYWRSVVTPGSELMTSTGTTLIAESPRLIALRNVLRRLLGHSANRQPSVDCALQMVHRSIACRLPIVLMGEGDLFSIARLLHRVIRGALAPFYSCIPSRAEQRPSLLGQANCPRLQPALAAAAGGSLCVHTRDMPERFDELILATARPASRVLLFVCANPRSRIRLESMAIRVSDLETRQSDIPCIVDEFICEAVGALPEASNCLLEEDRQWLVNNAGHSLQELEQAVYCEVARRTFSHMGDAMRFLGIGYGPYNEHLILRGAR